MYKALVVGGTGATGSHLIRQLINNDKFSFITSVGRKPCLNPTSNDKIINVVVDSMLDLSSTQKHWDGNDIFFNCLGTTRSKAGGAKEFMSIEHGMSYEAARMAFISKIQNVSIISANGADHRKWAPEWIYPLFYMQTMGKKEQTVISDFPFRKALIFKPGMLVRLTNKPTLIERLFESSGTGLRVDTLASAMIHSFEVSQSSNKTKGTKFYVGNSMIKDCVNG